MPEGGCGTSSKRARPAGRIDPNHDTAETLGLEDAGVIDAVAVSDSEYRGCGSPLPQTIGARSRHLRLRTLDPKGTEIVFKIKRSTPLRKLMEAFSRQHGGLVAPNLWRFERVLPLSARRLRAAVWSVCPRREEVLGEDTAESLGLQDEAVIYVSRAGDESPFPRLPTGAPYQRGDEDSNSEDSEFEDSRIAMVANHYLSAAVGGY